MREPPFGGFFFCILKSVNPELKLQSCYKLSQICIYANFLQLYVKSAVSCESAIASANRTTHI